jgi:DNA-binding NarL/FixJ family response regulator
MFLLNKTRWRAESLTIWDNLTDSELTVVRLIAEGATNRFVAGQLQLSPYAVKTHVDNAFAKLGITSRAH